MEHLQLMYNFMGVNFGAKEREAVPKFTHSNGTGEGYYSTFRFVCVIPPQVMLANEGNCSVQEKRFQPKQVADRVGPEGHQANRGVVFGDHEDVKL